MGRAEWPVGGKPDADALKQFAALQAIVVSVRNLRAEMKVDVKKDVEALIAAPGSLLPALKSEQAVMEALAKMKASALAEKVAKPQGAAEALAGEAQVFMPLAGLLDLGAEKARLSKEKEKASTLLAAQLKKLENGAFVSKAPAKVIEAERAKVAELQAAIAKLEQSVKDLGA